MGMEEQERVEGGSPKGHKGNFWGCWRCSLSDCDDGFMDIYVCQYLNKVLKIFPNYYHYTEYILCKGSYGSVMRTPASGRFRSGEKLAHPRLEVSSLCSHPIASRGHYVQEVGLAGHQHL